MPTPLRLVAEAHSDDTAESVFPPEQRTQVLAQLRKLLASASFAGSQRRSRLLRYLVEAALAGRGAEINEYSIGLDVFERPPSFDPRIESTVRAEISRLRARLKEYYAREGSADPVLIDFGSRGYAANFVFRDAGEPVTAAPELPPPTSALPVRPWRWVALCAVLVVALAGGLAVWQHRSGARQPIRSLVVLPFANLSANPRNEYLADGLTEELTNELAQWQDLRVVARTSAFQFKGKGVDVRQVGRLLGVDAVLEGSIQGQGDRLRVTAQFNRASNGFHIWSRQFEARSADTLAVQDEIVRDIAAAIRGSRLALPRVPGTTANAEAHDLYMQGAYQSALQTAASLRQSIGLF